MPKTLTLVRHAKSSWSDDSIGDFDRPLNARGLAAAPVVGAYLAARPGFTPDTIVSSPALRAISTAKILANALGIPDAIRTEASIYEASPSVLFYLASSLPAEAESAVLVGHNPGMHALADELLGTASIDSFVTCAVAILEFDIDAWGDLHPGGARLLDFVTPKGLAPQ